MDSLLLKTSYGDSSHIKLRKDKEKSADKVPHCNLLRDNTSLARQPDQLQDKCKMKKLKKKKYRSEDNSEEIVTELSDSVQPDRKKRKLHKGVCATEDSGRVEQIVDASSSPKKKKRSIEKNVDTCKQTQVEDLAFENLGNVAGRKKKKRKNEPNQSTPKECFSGEQCVKDTSADCTAELGSSTLYDFAMAGIKSYEEASSSTRKKKRSIEKSVDTCRQNQTDNVALKELGIVAGKKKKKKKKNESNLSTLEESSSGEQGVKDTSAGLAAQLKGSTLHDHLIAGIKSCDGTPSFKKKKKTRSEYSFEEISSSRVKEEVVKEVFSPPLKARKHKSSLCVDKGGKSLKIKKGKSLEENSCAETNESLLLLPSSGSAEGNDSDVTILNDCLKRQRKEKKCGGKISSIETFEANHENKSLHQENIVDKLWNEIKLQIEGKIQDGKKNKKEEAASQQPDEVLEEDHLNEVEGGCYTMVFKFDSNPIVRHYIPKKLMAFSGVDPQLQNMTEINLEIPRTYFKGSSLDEIPGYGYNT